MFPKGGSKGHLPMKVSPGTPTGGSKGHLPNEGKSRGTTPMATKPCCEETTDKTSSGKDLLL